jgi:carbamoyltransferase
MYILGIWDGHDAGAAILQDDKIVVAINEERLSKRKLEPCFPVLSINACLAYAKLRPTDISIVACSTSDFAKTLTRAFPGLKENYYRFRRRKVDLPALQDLRRNFKYRITELPSSGVTLRVTKYFLRKQLARLGFKNYKLDVVDHHMAHAASAAYTSPFKKALVITLDGIGDATSATINVLESGNLKTLSRISGKDSLGIFYEQVTNLLGMRELEDEGKVMALSNYSFEIPDEKNKMMDFFKVDGLNIKSKYSVSERYARLKKILWSTPFEQFAYMAQKTLEKNMIELFRNAVHSTGIKTVAWAGGVASNIKANMRVAELVKEWHVFPHMGDGGQALGSALYVNAVRNGITKHNLDNVYLGQDFSDDEILSALRKHKLNYESHADIGKVAADIVSNDFLLWFQGRMEYGPRALGNRSILAPANSLAVKDKLNISFKKRNWFQPFCPSILEEDAGSIFQNVRQYDKFMVMGYHVKPDAVDSVRAVINVDNTARPQMVGEENPLFRNLLREVKKNTGLGAVLNTSFNLHGYPLVCSPEDAITVQMNTKAKYLVIGNYLIEQSK